MPTLMIVRSIFSSVYCGEKNSQKDCRHYPQNNPRIYAWQQFRLLNSETENNIKTMLTCTLVLVWKWAKQSIWRQNTSKNFSRNWNSKPSIATRKNDLSTGSWEKRALLNFCNYLVYFTNIPIKSSGSGRNARCMCWWLDTKSSIIKANVLEIIFS